MVKDVEGYRQEDTTCQKYSNVKWNDIVFDELTQSQSIWSQVRELVASRFGFTEAKLVKEKNSMWRKCFH